MPIWRLQTCWQVGSAFPRDRFCINPVFRDDGLGTDPTQLATDWATAVDNWSARKNELVVKAYDVEGSAPVYPQATVKKNIGATMEATMPREIALCLSFYGDHNIPRERGRLYIPAMMIGTTSPMGVRPTTADLTKVAALVPILTALGGVDVDWGVWSQSSRQFKPAKAWWVDDEWDVQRRRGLRASTRQTGTTSEG